MAERAESPYVRYPVFISGALIAVYMYQDWDKIMKAATPIFLPQNDESVNNWEIIEMKRIKIISNYNTSDGDHGRNPAH